MLNFIKFCLVGGSNTLVTLSIFYIFNKILHINYISSSVIGYLIGMINSYVLNKKWTFHDDEKRLLSQFIRFTLVNGLSLGLNLLIMFVLVDKLHIDSMLSQIIATAFSTVSNFAGSKLLVFHSVEVSK